MAQTEKIQRRFKRWRERFGHSLREVQEEVNAHLPEGRQISVGTVSNYETSGMAPPRSDFVAALKKAYPDLNTDWLLTGEGEMTVIQDVAARRAMELGARPAKMDLAVDFPAKNALVAAWAVLVEAHAGEPGDMEYDVGPTVSKKMMEQLENAAEAPLWVLEDYVEVSPGEAYSDFIASVAMAIRRYAQAAPAQPEQNEREEENNGSE